MSRSFRNVCSASMHAHPGAAPGRQSQWIGPTVPVEVHLIEPLGSCDIVDLRLGGETLRARTRAGFARGTGERLWASVDPAQAHLFDTRTGRSLGVRL